MCSLRAGVDSPGIRREDKHVSPSIELGLTTVQSAEETRRGYQLFGFFFAAVVLARLEGGGGGEVACCRWTEMTRDGVRVPHTGCVLLLCVEAVCRRW